MCNLYSSKNVLSSENNSTYSIIDNKTEYTLSDNSYNVSLIMQSHMSYSSCSCFCLLDRTIQICVSCFRAVQIWCFEYNPLILVTGCSTWHLIAKNSLEDLRIRIVALHKDGLGYKKFGNSLETELQYSGQGHTEVLQGGFHSEQASQGFDRRS